MKKIVTLLSILFFGIAANAQQVSITLDSVYYSPANPVIGDSVYLHINGSANCQIAQQGPAYITNAGVRDYTFNVCYIGNPNTAPSTFFYTYAIYRANLMGNDTLEWAVNYNKYSVNLCDTVFDNGIFFINVAPTAIISQQSPALTVNWNQYASAVNVDRLATKANFELMDMSGRTVQRQQLNAGSTEVKVGTLQEGIYLVYISDNEGMLYRKKIFISENRN